MAVTFDSSTSKYSFGISGTSGNISTTHIVNTLASDLVAVVGALYLGNTSTAGTISATFGGTSMTNAGGSTNFEPTSRFQVFTLVDPGTGPQTVQVNVSGFGGGGVLALVSATYSGVSSIGSVVTATGAPTTSNAVTVSSSTASNRVVTLHAVGLTGIGNAVFSGYDKVIRATTVPFNGIFDYGEILLGDAQGAASVTATATQSSAWTTWGAFGMSLAPAIVKGDASLSVYTSTVGSGHIYRVGTPAPQRTWLIES